MNDKDFQQALSEMVILVDTRENVNQHITDVFDKRGIKWVSKKLSFGDYSFSYKDKSFETKIVFERKNSLDELSGNIAQNRERFKAELERAKADKAKLILLVENGSYEKILTHKYRTDLNEKSYIASLFSFQARYDIEVKFIEDKLTAWLIYNTFKYYLREELKGD